MKLIVYPYFAISIFCFTSLSVHSQAIMRINLSNGETLTIDIEDILKITFDNCFTTTTDVNQKYLHILGQLKSYPNPASEQSIIAFDLMEAGKVQILAYDLYGHLVYNKNLGHLQAGTQVFHWDLADNSGHKVRAGTYFIIASCENQKLVEKLIVIK